MKRTIASIGLVAVGVSALQAQNAPVSKSGDDKSWSISTSLKGFYDDNFNNRGSDLAKKSCGVEFTPSFFYSLTTVPDTTLTFGAGYNSRNYTEKNITDQSVETSIFATHKFDKTRNITVQDRFVDAQEPEVLESETAAKSTVLRAQGNNIHNSGQVAAVQKEVIKSLDVQLSYANDLYVYDNPDFKPLLDRMEHDADLSLRYGTGHGIATTKTGALLLDYQFGDTEYSDTILDQGNALNNPHGLESSIRNQRSHAVTAGYTERIGKNLDFTVRGGVQYFDFYNTGDTKTSPLVMADLTWRYVKKGKLTVGARHQHSATDVLQGSVAEVLSANSLVLDMETTSAYVKAEQPLSFISERLSATLYGFYQYSKFDGGVFAADQDTEGYYLVDSKLSYELVTKIIFADIGYTYAQLSSPSRGFERNRGYVGLTAKF